MLRGLLVQFMDGAKSQGPAFAAFPRKRWRRNWFINPSKRLNTEIKRRARLGGVFPNETAVIRLIGAVLDDPQ